MDVGHVPDYTLQKSKVISTLDVNVYPQVYKSGFEWRLSNSAPNFYLPTTGTPYVTKFSVIGIGGTVAVWATLFEMVDYTDHTSSIADDGTILIAQFGYAEFVYISPGLWSCRSAYSKRI